MELLYKIDSIYFVAYLIPAALLLVQFGYYADNMMRMYVGTINGCGYLRNTTFVAKKADLKFLDLLNLLRSLQKMDGITFSTGWQQEDYDDSL